MDGTFLAARRTGRVRLIDGVLAAAVGLLLMSSSASAASPSLSLGMTSLPTHLAPGETGQIVLNVTNAGAASTSGPVTVTVDPLPAGLTATSLTQVYNADGWACDVLTLTCTRVAPRIADGETSSIILAVDVSPSASGTLTTSATAAGGGSSSISAVNHAEVDATPAGFGITTFSGEVTATDARDPATLAASHPYDASTLIQFNTVKDAGGFMIPAGDGAKDIQVDLPAGFVGNPTAAPTCTEDQLDSRDFSGDPLCPAGSQVGVTTVYTFGVRNVTVAVFNMVPPDGVAGTFGFNVAGTPIHLNASVRTTSDYGLTVTLPNISQALPMTAAALTFWGVSADPIHNTLRGACLALNMANHPTPAASCAASLPPVPFLTNPANCSAGLLTTGLASDPWANPGAFDTASFDHDVNGVAMQVKDCERVPFDPSADVSATTSSPSSPTGLDVDLDFPQDGLNNPTGLATAPLKKATVTLPQGMSINPSAADGLTACSDADMRFQSDAPVQCAGSSKIGDAEATSPLLEEKLTGGIYMRSQNSMDPESGEMFRIGLVLENKQRGLSIRLPGSIRANAQTGQLTATFDNNPQLPVSNIHLSFKSGPRAPLATPATCGTFTTNAALTPWSSDVAVNKGSSFVLDQACDQAGKFEPSLSAGVINPKAGGSSPFSLTLSRPDGQQDISGLDVTLPRGVLGYIGSVPLCPDANAANGTCGAASQVGRVIAAAGAGSSPLYVPQAGKAPTAVYLAGPYKGAPFSLSIVVPAQAGPFDLGTIVVRAALFVDKDDAHVTVKSDPIPTIRGGVPLRMQKLNVTLDRPGFMVSPSNCAPSQVTAAVGSIAGALANISSRFQVGDCGSLQFRPKMTLKVGARGKLTRGKRTPLEVTLTMPRGDANNRAVTVTLPKTLNARLDVVNKRRACSIQQFNADRCPMVVGTGTAVTPLLRDPLKGPAYFVYNPARRLPDLVVRLKGKVAIDLVGKVTITRDLRLQTTFDAVPDAPITKFRLALESGGRNGPIGTTRNLCLPEIRRALKADVAITAQSNKKVSRSQTISVAGCARSSTRGRSRRAARGRARRTARARRAGRRSRK